MSMCVVSRPVSVPQVVANVRCIEGVACEAECEHFFDEGEAVEDIVPREGICVGCASFSERIERVGATEQRRTDGCHPLAEWQVSSLSRD
jgi:hypothetical protein